MIIQSAAFTHNGSIPAKYTCDGENVNPPLAISDVPGNAKSLVLVVDDPDAPNGDWVHWLAWNIDAQSPDIPEDGFPEGVAQGKTSFGTTGYGGPCPPSGTHRYFFKVYALDDMLGLAPGADKQQLEQAMDGHVIQQAELVGLYSRE